MIIQIILAVGAVLMALTGGGMVIMGADKKEERDAEVLVFGGIVLAIFGLILGGMSLTT